MRSFIINLALVLTSSFLTVLILEAGIRLWSGVPLFQQIEFSQAGNSQPDIGCANRFDPELGWKPEPFREGVNSSGAQVSILATGVRSNGQKKQSGSPIVFAVGDSFTFGDRVSDNQSWPAALERTLQSPVLNGGACGYGIGQSVRRGELLIGHLDPDILIVGMIPTDIDRTRAVEFYGRKKPYFEFEAGELVYRSEHLADSLADAASRSQESFAEDSTMKIFTRLLDDHSLLWRSLPDIPHMVDAALSRVSLIRGTAHTYVSSNGVEISCRLLRRIKSFEQERGLKAFLLIQYKYRDILNRIRLEEGRSTGSESNDMRVVAESIDLIACADQLGLRVIDTFASLRELYINGGRASLAGLYDDHMTSKGNEFVADVIAGEIMLDPGENRP
jgi:hypothetical protein